MRRKGRYFGLILSGILVFGLLTLSLEREVRRAAREGGAPTESGDGPAENDGGPEVDEDGPAAVDREAFREMDFGEDGLFRLCEWARERGVDPAEAVSRWMAAAHYDLGGLVFDGQAPERFGALPDARREDASGGDSQGSTVSGGYAADCYAGLLADLEVFPVPKNADPACAFVTFQNDWGNPRTYGGDRRHEGCDLMGDRYAAGTYPVLSMTDGVVEQMGWLTLGGWRVGIRSENGIYYYYAHLASYAEGLAVGKPVSAGEEIGRMGATGYGGEGTSGKFAVHLHVGIYLPVEGQEDMSVNPYYLMRYLQKKRVATRKYGWEEPEKEGVFGLWNCMPGGKNLPLMNWRWRS